MAPSKKLARQAPNNAVAPTARRASSGWFAGWAVLVVCLLAAGGGTWAFFELVVWNTIPAELVGKWVVQGGEQDGATFDFYRSGAMIGRINVGGKEGIVNARVVIDGENLHITTQNPQTRQNETKTQRIKVLTANELVLQDERKNIFRMTRAD